MKARKFLLAAALIVASLLSMNGVMAQTDGATVTVNIKLTHFQSIAINAETGANVVDFNYATIDDYQNGVDGITKDNQLVVNSTGPFVVNVSSTAFTGGIKEMGPDHVAVTAILSDATVNKISSDLSYGSFALSSIDQPLITSSDQGGMDQMFNVTYTNPGGANGEYFKDYINGEDQVYKATVTYTITTI